MLQQLLAEGFGQPGLPPRSCMPPSPLRGLILLPTRELALQVRRHPVIADEKCTTKKPQRKVPIGCRRDVATAAAESGSAASCGSLIETRTAVYASFMLKAFSGCRQVEQRLRAIAGPCGIGSAVRLETSVMATFCGFVCPMSFSLCMQVEQHLRAIAGPCGIGSAAIVGGLSAVKQVPLSLWPSP